MFALVSNCVFAFCAEASKDEPRPTSFSRPIDFCFALTTSISFWILFYKFEINSLSNDQLGDPQRTVNHFLCNFEPFLPYFAWHIGSSLAKISLSSISGTPQFLFPLLGKKGHYKKSYRFVDNNMQFETAPITVNMLVFSWQIYCFDIDMYIVHWKGEQVVATNFNVSSMQGFKL